MVFLVGLSVGSRVGLKRAFAALEEGLRVGLEDGCFEVGSRVGLGDGRLEEGIRVGRRLGFVVVGVAVGTTLTSQPAKNEFLEGT